MAKEPVSKIGGVLPLVGSSPTASAISSNHPGDTMMIRNLLTQMKQRISMSATDYLIPREWLPTDYSGNAEVTDSGVLVNPYEFASTLLRGYLLSAETRDNRAPRSGTDDAARDSSWIHRSRIYCSFVRSTSAFSHSHHTKLTRSEKPGYTNTGTFLKMIFMLPHISRMHFDCVYLLPITLISNRYKKGELGSPYSVRNFFRPDPCYHDSLLDGFNVEEEFQAFVEACHALEIKVLLDFMPRTAARDSELIADNPEWFYWIDASVEDQYSQPRIPGLDFKVPSKEDLEAIYRSDHVQRHLKFFRYAPSVTHPEKWANFVELKRDSSDFFDELTRVFGVVTAPAFSDWINDTQPVWTDITFLRLYLDNPRDSQPFLKNHNQPPYILQDIIKASNFPGNRPNTDLWRLLEDIMPYYIREYGIDGARLDMGHALPDELEHSIIASARQHDPSFAIIAEELQMEKDVESKKAGYDCILGNTWWMMPRIQENRLQQMVTDVLPGLQLPTLACCETPDTPRAAARARGKDFSTMMTILSFFLPNAIPFVNSGQEIFEVQPMNLGLDNSPEGRFVLPKDDPLYGKLAFFDNYSLHWNTTENLINTIVAIAELHRSYKNLMNESNLRILSNNNSHLSGLFYWDGGKGVLVLLNTDFTSKKCESVDLGYHTWKVSHRVSWCIRESHPTSLPPLTIGSRLEVILIPGETAVALIE